MGSYHQKFEQPRASRGSGNSAAAGRSTGEANDENVARRTAALLIKASLPTAQNPMTVTADRDESGLDVEALEDLERLKEEERKKQADAIRGALPFTEAEVKALRRSEPLTLSSNEVQELRQASFSTMQYGATCSSPHHEVYALRSKKFLILAEYVRRSSGCHHDTPQKGLVAVTGRRNGKAIRLTKAALEQIIDIVREKSRALEEARILPRTADLEVQDRYVTDDKAEREYAVFLREHQHWIQRQEREEAERERKHNDPSRIRMAAVDEFHMLLAALERAHSPQQVKQYWDELVAIAAKYPQDLKDKLPSLQAAYKAAFIGVTSTPTSGLSSYLDLDSGSLIALGVAAGLDAEAAQRRVQEPALAVVDAVLRESRFHSPNYPQRLLGTLQAYTKFVGEKHAAKTLRADARLWGPVEAKLAEAIGSDKIVGKYTHIFEAPGWQELHKWLSALPK